MAGPGQVTRQPHGLRSRAGTRRRSQVCQGVRGKSGAPAGAIGGTTRTEARSGSFPRRWAERLITSVRRRACHDRDRDAIDSVTACHRDEPSVDSKPRHPIRMGCAGPGIPPIAWPGARHRSPDRTLLGSTEGVGGAQTGQDPRTRCPCGSPQHWPMPLIRQANGPCRRDAADLP